MESKNYYSCKLLSLILIISQIRDLSGAKVQVKIYDHRAYHDPIQLYGRGPWKYFGHGYGIDYGYDHDKTHSHEKGYGFVKAYGREFCKPGVKCRPPDPNFWKMISPKESGFSPEPYFARPPADVKEPNTPKTNFMADDHKTLYWRNYFMNKA